MENPQPAHQEDPPTQYPTGRGYGHDYMRGGEVFGGYGYRDRDEYGRSGDERDEELAPDEEHRRRESRASRQNSGEPEVGDEDDRHAPVPQLEHTFGLHAVGGHSRSFYVTQAQLQQRIYRPRRESEESGEEENPSPS